MRVQVCDWCSVLSAREILRYAMRSAGQMRGGCGGGVYRVESSRVLVPLGFGVALYPQAQLKLDQARSEEERGQWAVRYR